MSTRDGVPATILPGLVPALALALAVCLALELGSACPAHAEDSLVRERLERMCSAPGEAERATFARQVLFLDPEKVTRSFCEGYLALLEGRDAEAEKLLASSLAKRRGFGAAPYLFGDAYASRGRLAEAAAAYRRAVAAEPKLLPARLQLCRTLLAIAAAPTSTDTTARGLAREVVDAARAGLAFDPQDVALHLALGDARVAAGLPAEAVLPYTVADQLRSSDAAIERRLGFLHATLGDSKRARSFLAASVQHDPSHGGAVRKLADLYGERGNLLDAIAVLSRGWKPVRDPAERAGLRREIGFGLLAFGERGSSREHLAQAQAVLRDEPSARALAWIDSTASSSAGMPLEQLRVVLPTWDFSRLREEMAQTDICWPPPEALPELTRLFPPVYPEDARSRGDEGIVLVKGLVSASGRVLQSVVTESSGSALLDAAAVEAFGKSDFRPAQGGSGPLSCWVQVPIRFSMERMQGVATEGGANAPAFEDPHLTLPTRSPIPESLEAPKTPQPVTR